VLTWDQVARGTRADGQPTAGSRHDGGSTATAVGWYWRGIETSAWPRVRYARLSRYPNWSTAAEDAGRDDAGWNDVAVGEGGLYEDFDRLTTSPAPLVRRVATLRPTSVAALPDGRQIIDLGQNARIPVPAGGRPSARAHPDDVTGVVVHSDLERAGWFDCSDERINRLHEAAVWSFRDNACDVPTDCPQREHTAWTGAAPPPWPTRSAARRCAASAAPRA
jgi:hypothetical protein